MSEHAEQTLIASCYSHPGRTDAQEFLLELTPDHFEGIAEGAVWCHARSGDERVAHQ